MHRHLGRGWGVACEMQTLGPHASSFCTSDMFPGDADGLGTTLRTTGLDLSLYFTEKKMAKSKDIY